VTFEELDAAEDADAADAADAEADAETVEATPHCPGCGVRHEVLAECRDEDGAEAEGGVL
jgi:hypothetical protein